MELKQIRTIMDVRRSFLIGCIVVSAMVVLVSGVICNYVVRPRSGIPIFTVIVFATFVIMLSIFYDIYINSSYRLFIMGEDVYIYYPTYSSRVGNEFIFYKVEDVAKATIRGSSIVFTGHVVVKTEGLKRPEMKKGENLEEVFADVFKDNTYTISKKFRISRIFEGEDLFMGLLNDKKTK